MIGQTISHYRIVEKLGEGGMGVVYKAEDTKLARTVALKFLGAHLLSDPEAKQRFLREAQAAAALNHPNICTVHEIDEAEGRTFIAMAFVEGESLEREIARGPLPIKEALDVAHQIAKGLQAAHNKGIIHRDIKPANILLARDGPVTIMDFGLARLTEASRLTRAGKTMGTVAYMSPEQAQGHEVDHRSDIWSLGVVLYEMICGQRPFRGEYDQALCYEIVNEEPAPLTGLRTGVPLELEWMVGKALAKEAGHRYQQPEELAVDLVNLSDKLRSGRSAIFRGGISPAPGTEAVSPRWHGQNRATWVLGALALLALATALVLAVVRFRATPSAIPAYELTVDLPPGTTIHTFSLSPDGRHVALALTQQQGQRRLWVRSMDDRLAREVPGTAGAQYPFWAPDSRYIGFFAERKLKKVALAGGPPQTLCDADEGRGGTWNTAGVILFAPTPFGQLVRVSEGGGEPVAVTKPEESAPQVSRRFPWFLPDGRHFLYSDRTTLPERAGIYVSSIEGSEPRRLLPDNANAVYAPGDTPGGGFILFVRDNNLLAQPFDSGSLELTGDAFPVAESVGGVANIGTYGFTASAGGSLVYVSGGGFLTFWDSQLAWFDRTGKQLQPLGKPASLLSLSLSPDETRAALDIGEAGQVDIWLLEFARGTLSRLTTKSVDAAWSADGTRIAFTSARDGLPRIYRKAASGVGEDETLLLNDSSSPNVRLKDWSPDGRFLLYAIQQPKTTIDLWVLPLEGDRKPFVFVETEFREDLPRFSPDSRWVAYQSDESGRFEVYIRPFPGADRKWQISTEGGSTPVWSKDGRELYYIAPDLKLMAVALKAGDTIEAGPPQARFQTRLPMLNYGPVAPLYDVSRDGRFLIANRVDDGRQSEQRKLVHVTNWRAKVGK